MVKVAGLTLSLLFALCSPAMAADPEQQVDGDNKGGSAMVEKKKNASEKPSEAKAPTSETKKFNGREKPDWVYHLSQAQWHARTLREQTMVKVAHAIEERGWNQTQAAQFLGVSQPRISDLMRGQSQKFTLDSLVEMLYALDKPAMLVIDDSKHWGVSNGLPLSEKDLQESVEYYSNTIKIDPKDSSAYRKRADAYSSLKKYDLAIGDLTRCIELTPDRPGDRSTRALVYRDAGQYQAAINDCDDLLRLFPGYNAYQNRGIIYDRMGEKDKALADYSKAIELDPQRPGPWWNRACFYERNGKFKEAISDFENTLKADPTYQIAKEKVDELKKKLTT